MLKGHFTVQISTNSLFLLARKIENIDYYLQFLKTVVCSDPDQNIIVDVRVSDSDNS